MFKVSKSSDPKAVAGAIAGEFRRGTKSIELHAVGASAINQALKAVAIARGYLAPNGIDLVCVPAFMPVTIEDAEKTGIKLLVQNR